MALSLHAQMDLALCQLHFPAANDSTLLEILQGKTNEDKLIYVKVYPDLILILIHIPN